MRQQTIWYIWLSVGYICASPYYYREDKHQAEHHHEYSYSGHEPSQVPESIPEGQGIPHISLPVKPERYSTYVSPAQVSSYSQNHGGGYSFSQESSQHGSSYQSSIPVSSQQHYVQSTHYTSPVVVQRKVVKFYSYPAGTTQTSHIHMVGSGREIPVVVNQKEERFYTSGSQINGGQKEIDLQNIGGVHSFTSKVLNLGQESGQREVPENLHRGTADIGLHQESIHNPIKLTYSPGVSTHKVERHYEIRRVGNLGTHTQKEGLLGQLGLGQNVEIAPPLNVLQNSRQEKFITSSQQLYHNAGSRGLELGQKEEDSFGQKEEDSFGQKEEDSFGQKEEDSFGQKEEDSFGQTEEKDSLLHIKETGQKAEPLNVFQPVVHGIHQNPYQKHESQSLEIGQKEESLTGQEPIVLGQQDGNLGQTEEKESLYHSKYSSLEVGQKEGLLTGQEPVDFMQQPEENAGQTEEKESAFHNKYSSLQVGQMEEPLQGLNVFSPHRGQGSHYQNHGSEILTIGQKEGAGQKPLDLGQKEEALFGQEEEKESLYNSKYSSLEVGQKEESVHGFTTVSQHSESGSLYPSHGIGNSRQGSLYQRHESQSLVTGQKEEPLTGQEPIVTSQREESLIGQQGDNFGQTEDKESLYSTTYSKLETGQPKKPLQGLNVLSQHRREGSFYQKHESHSLVTGKKEEPFAGQESLDLGQKEEAIIGQQEENLGQTEKKENQHHIKYSSLETGQKEEPLQGFKVISQHVSHHSYYQNQGNQEPIKPSTVPESAALGQKEILQGQGKFNTLVIGQQQVPIYTNPHKYSYREEHSQSRVVDGSLGLGLKEPNYPKTDSIGLGQKEESEELYHESKVLGGQSKLFSGPIQSGHNGKVSHQHLEITQVGTGQIEEPIREIKPNFLEQKEQDEKPFSLGIHRGDSEYDVKEEKDTESLEHQPHGHRHHYHNGEAHRYHNGRSWHHSKSCTHGEHYQHGGFGLGQKGHDLEISSGRVKEVGNGNNGEQGLLYSSSHKESNHSVQEIHTSTLGKNDRLFPSETPIKKITGEVNKHLGSNLDLDKMVEDLAKTLEVDGIMMNPNSIASTQTITSTPSVHVAEIEELGLENLKSQSSLQSKVISSPPEQKVKIFETHKEEIGLDYPTSRKTYSKKHSRHYSVKQESHSSLPGNTEQNPQVVSQSHSGRWQGYSQYGSSAAFVGDKYFANGQPVKREASSGTDRQATIDSFLSELDKEIARENRKPGQSSFVQVSSLQHQSQSQPGTSLYPTSSGQGESSWFKKIGDNISSTYNKAKDRISDTLSEAKEKISGTISQAKDKAKEIAHNVKDSF